MGVDREHRAWPRPVRLAMLGAAGGTLAALVFVAAGGALLFALRALWQLVIPDVQAGLALPPLLELRRFGAIIAGFVGAGIVAGAAGSWLRASERADRRSFCTLLLAGAVGGWIATYLGEGAPHSLGRAAAILLLSAGLGALGWIGLWPRTVRAVRQASGPAIRTWLIARRVGAFSVGLFALLVGAPLSFLVLMVVVTGIANPRPPFDWAGNAMLVVSCLLSLGAGVAGLYLADVPRTYDTGDTPATQCTLGGEER